MGEQKQQRAELGFTIIEVMIVLAVMGAMFLGAVLLVSGRQNQTEFTQAIGQIQSQTQQTIDYVIDGYYPATTNFTCTAAPLQFTSGGTVQQGVHNGCIFLGQVMQFGINGSNGSNQQFNIYNIAGDQCTAATSSYCNYLNQSTLSSGPGLLEAEPTVIKGTGVDTTDDEGLENGLSVSSMYYNGSPSDKTYAVGFLQSLGDSGGSSLSSGAQQVDLWAISGTSIGSAEDETDAVAAINDVSNWQSVSEVDICFTSGTTNQSGLITIGGTNSAQLAVGVTIYSNTSCSS